MSASNRRVNRRAHPRRATTIDVRVTLEDGTELVGKSIDLGVGGMCVSTGAAPPFGASVTLQFRLPALDMDTAVQATVRWVDDAGRAGMQFGSLRARDVWAINQLFR